MSKHNKHTTVEVVEPSVPKSDGSVTDKKVVPEGFDEKDVALEEKIIDAVGQHTEDPNTKHEDLKTETKKGKAGKKGKDSTPKTEETKVEEVPKHTCGECKWYNHAEERIFARNGIREGLTEIRAVCRSPTSKARNHLVMRDSTKHRECLELGTYVAPEKPSKKKESKVAETKITETKIEETKDPTPGVQPGIESLEKPKTTKVNAHERRQKQKSVAINNLASSDGEVAQLTKTNGSKVVTVQKVQ